MVDLASNQDNIRKILSEGQKLLQSKPSSNDKNVLSAREKQTITKGMESLNSKWEDVRKQSMERQNK